MKFVDLIRLSSRMFKYRLTRTILTIAGVSVAIGTILFLVSLGYGLQRTLLSRITTSESLLTLDASSDSQQIILDQKTIDGLLTIPGVVAISPKMELPGQVSIGEGELSSDMSISLVRDDFFQLSGMKTLTGTFFDQKTPGVVVSQAVATLFGLDQGSIIDQKLDILLFAPRLTSGEGLLEDVPEIDLVPIGSALPVIGLIDDEANPKIFISLAVIEGKIAPVYQLAKIKVAATDQLEAVRTALIDKGLTVSALSDLVDQANKIFTAFQVILAIFGIIALVVSAIGLFNTMTIALLERVFYRARHSTGLLIFWLRDSGASQWTYFIARCGLRLPLLDFRPLSAS
ncbi:MAG: Macrolide export ATP-binding/permease protein [Parcubacteria group bacterium GW2011_GWA2_47_8]|nr:MAG: Macrolide export ATP-binding/permease protein [Parcubacteria group bacterium GW2011_GWA2_47_8]